MYGDALIALLGMWIVIGLIVWAAFINDPR